jgi:hypothetical protein
MTGKHNTAVNVTAEQKHCDHGVVFDVLHHLTEGLSSRQVRALYPRLDGVCPKGCGYVGIAYASFAHYIAGDW